MVNRAQRKLSQVVVRLDVIDHSPYFPFGSSSFIEKTPPTPIGELCRPPHDPPQFDKYWSVTFGLGRTIGTHSVIRDITNDLRPVCCQEESM